MEYNKDNVGILAMDVYFPSTYVKQEDLEIANEIPAGKYTVGLGQKAMAFTGDREDINSFCLTVAHSLMEKYNISPNDIGRIEVGTETIVDKSKSTKTFLMDLMGDNTDVEGATVVNACYGGTAALLNALTWVDSSSWDGRYALVVAADIAVYAEGPARPTGGAGAVAMLIGKNAPLPIDLKTRATHASHVWDFFKPDLSSEYPTVNGALSNVCYLRALDDCYNRFVKKQALCGIDRSVASSDYILFHSPYNKLVQKSLARMIFLDILAGKRSAAGFEKFLTMPLDKTYDDKELESKLKDVASKCYNEKVVKACEVSKLIGNTYTASVYMNLANLVADNGDNLADKSVTLFSYGSGAIASMFELKPKRNAAVSLNEIQKSLDLHNRLASRELLTPDDLNLALTTREAAHIHGKYLYQPTFLTDNMFPGTYYLDQVNAASERLYKRKPLTSSRVVGGALTSLRKMMK